MAHHLLLAVRPKPSAEELPRLRVLLETSFPARENALYLDALYGNGEHPVPPRVAAERLGALSLLPSLLEAAGIEPTPLRLRRDSHGRPFCELPCGHVCFDFNLSHTATCVAGALLTGGGRVGVDVEEPIPEKRALPLVHRFCTEEELTLLQGLSEAETADGFTRIWTVREALSKQDGQGMPLTQNARRIPAELTVVSRRLEGGGWLSVCLPAEAEVACRELISRELIPVPFFMKSF